MKFQMEYTHNGNDQWQYTVLMPNGNTKTFAYKLGQEFDSNTLDGRPIIVSDTYSCFQQFICSIPLSLPCLGFVSMHLFGFFTISKSDGSVKSDKN